MAEIGAKAPGVAMRIAVSTGDVVVGNIGSERRSKYAAVGSAINLAARIEANSHANEVMISDATRSSVGDVAHVAEVREIVAKGFDGPVRIHRVTAVDGSYDA